MRYWMALLLVVFTTACSTATITPVIVQVSEEPFVEPTATPECLHAEGVTLEVTRLSDTRVALHISGLQPGEKPYITFYASTPYRSSEITSGIFAEGADEQGNFTFEQGGLLPLEGDASSTWDIRLIHARGVECATITLP